MSCFCWDVCNSTVLSFTHRKVIVVGDDGYMQYVVTVLKKTLRQSCKKQPPLFWDVLETRSYFVVWTGRGAIGPFTRTNTLHVIQLYEWQKYYTQTIYVMYDIIWWNCLYFAPVLCNSFTGETECRFTNNSTIYYDWVSSIPEAKIVSTTPTNIIFSNYSSMYICTHLSLITQVHSEILNIWVYEYTEVV